MKNQDKKSESGINISEAKKSGRNSTHLPARILRLGANLAVRIILRAACAAAVICAVFFGGKTAWEKIGEIRTEKSHALIFRELQRCSELVTAKSAYSDIISIKKTRIAGLAKSFSIIKYSGIIRAGIPDISEAEINVSDRGKKARITLPKIAILSNDISNIEVFDESKSIFVSISVEEIMSEINFNKEAAEAEIFETGLIEEAETQAVNLIETLLRAAGFEDVEAGFKASVTDPPQSGQLLPFAYRNRPQVQDEAVDRGN